MTMNMNPKEWQKSFDEKFFVFKNAAYTEDKKRVIKSFITNLLEAVAVACEETKHTPIDSTAYLEAIRNAKHPFDDGFNHGREVAYEHTANLIRSLKGDE